jgi:acetyl-CoA carboxylase carboxyl transferase subunit alpha
LKLDVVDEIVPEPEGGAHRDYDSVAGNLSRALRRTVQNLSKIPIDELLKKRYEKFRRIGIFTESKTTADSDRS